MNSTCKQDPSDDICPQIGLLIIVLVMDGISICTMIIAMAKTSQEQNAPIKFTITERAPTGTWQRSKRETMTISIDLIDGPRQINNPKVPIIIISRSV